MYIPICDTFEPFCKLFLQKMAKKFIIIGSSNSVNIQNGHPTHDSLQNVKIKNYSRPGAEVEIYSEKSILKQLPKKSDNLHVIIFCGSNGIDNDHFNVLTLKYQRMILRVMSTLDSCNISCILPLVRGCDLAQHKMQLFFMNILKTRLESYGIECYNVHDYLSNEQKQISNLFGAKDIAKKNYVHISASCRQVVHELLAKIVEKNK